MNCYKRIDLKNSKSEFFKKLQMWGHKDLFQRIDIDQGSSDGSNDGPLVWYQSIDNKKRSITFTWYKFW